MPAALAALLPVMLIAGCGSSGPSSTSTDQSAQGASANPASAAYAYARCMRTHGVPSFPDPKVSVSPGHASVAFRVTPGETASPAFKSASKACQSILPGPQQMSPAEQRARKAGLLAFARCARSHGLAGFPDPTAEGKLSLQMVSAAGVDTHSRKFFDVAKACAGASNGVVKPADIAAAENGAH